MYIGLVSISVVLQAIEVVSIVIPTTYMKYGVYPRTNCCSVTKVLMLPDDKEEEDNVAVPKKATDDRRSMFSWAKHYHQLDSVVLGHHPGNDKRVSEQASEQTRAVE